jgi:transcriptional regulator with XRE-family HTH domain
MTHPLRRYLEREGLSQEAFALRAHTSRQTVWRILAGKGDFSLSTLRRVSDATGGLVSMADLLICAEPKKSEAA